MRHFSYSLLCVLLLVQDIAEGGDLGAVFAFVAVVHVDQHVVQRVGATVPGKGADLAQFFGGNAGYESHDLSVRVVELCQHVLNSVAFAPAYLAVVKLSVHFDEGVQGRGGNASSGERCQDVYQDSFVGGEVGENILNGPVAARARSFPRAFRKAIDSVQNCELTVLQNACCVHELILSVAGTCALGCMACSSARSCVVRFFPMRRIASKTKARPSSALRPILPLLSCIPIRQLAQPCEQVCFCLPTSIHQTKDTIVRLRSPEHLALLRGEIFEHMI